MYFSRAEPCRTNSDIGYNIRLLIITNACSVHQTRESDSVRNLSNTKYFLFGNIFRRSTPFEKSTKYLDLASKTVRDKVYFSCFCCTEKLVKDLQASQTPHTPKKGNRPKNKIQFPR